jgi:hypothetical protein
MLIWDLSILTALVWSSSALTSAPLPGTRSKASREWTSTDGIALLRNFFESSDFAAIQAEVAQLRRAARAEVNSFATGRMAAPLPASPPSPATGLMASPAMAERISRTVGRQVQPAGADFPPEVRFYGPGASMAWHRDDVAYAEPQVELILTVHVEGGFDGATQWRLPDGRVVGEILEPNSLLVVQAGGPEHQVTPVTRGHRSIVKAVFVSSFQRSDDFGRLSRAAAVAAPGRGGSRGARTAVEEKKKRKKLRQRDRRTRAQ